MGSINIKSIITGQITTSMGRHGPEGCENANGNDKCRSYVFHDFIPCSKFHGHQIAPALRFVASSNRFQDVQNRFWDMIVWIAPPP